jgi:Mn-dependent DtxR family transcriptional regulator
VGRKIRESGLFVNEQVASTRLEKKSSIPEEVSSEEKIVRDIHEKHLLIENLIFMIICLIEKDCQKRWSHSLEKRII